MHWRPRTVGARGVEKHGEGKDTPGAQERSWSSHVSQRLFFFGFLIEPGSGTTPPAIVSALRGMGPRLLETIPPKALTRVTGT